MPSLPPEYVGHHDQRRRREQRRRVLRTELLAGRMSLRDVLGEPAVGTLAVTRVIEWLPRWGPVRAARLLEEGCWPAINPTRRCRELTDRQRQVIGERVNW